MQFMDEAHFIGRSFYNESLDGAMIKFLEIAQPLAAMNLESYAKTLETLYANAIAWKEELISEWFAIDQKYFTRNEVVACMSDNIRYDTLMDIIKGYENSVGPSLDDVEDIVKNVAFFTSSLNDIVGCLNKIYDKSNQNTCQAISEFIIMANKKVQLPGGLPLIALKEENGKPTFTLPADDIMDKMALGTEAIVEILNGFGNLIVYYNNIETVEYLKELIPYMEEEGYIGEKYALEGIIHKFESLNFVLDTSWEVTKCFMLDVIGKNTKLALLNEVGDVTERVTGTQKTIDIARKMKVANNIVEAIIAKAKDYIQLYRYSPSDDLLISIWNDFSMCCQLDGLMNNYSVEYVKTYSKGALFWIRNNITKESCTVEELEYEIGIQAETIEWALEWAEEEIASLRN